MYQEIILHDDGDGAKSIGSVEMCGGVYRVDKAGDSRT
jgi:hypothetical protein